MKRYPILAVLALILIVGVVRTAGAGGTAMPVTTKSDEARDLYYKGWRFIDSGQSEKARPLFEKALSLDSDFALGHIGLAWSQPSFKDMFASAQRATELIETSGVTDAEKLYVQGAWASLNADMETWIGNTEKLAEMFPDDARAQYDLGNAILFGRSDPENALGYLESAVQANPDFTPVHNSLGWAHRQLGDYSKAEVSYKRYVELAPENPAAHDAFASLLLKLGRYEESTSSYKQALSYDAMYVSSHQGICTSLMLNDKHDAAREHIMMLYDKVPNDGIRSGIHFAASVIYADEGRFDDALGELEKNYGLSKKIGDHTAMRVDLGNMGRLLLEMGRPDEAMKKYDEGLAVVMESDQTDQRKEVTQIVHLFNEGSVLLAKHDIDGAKAKAEALEKRAADFGNIFITRAAHQLHGMIALETGEYDKAIDELSQANTGDAYNMFRMALAFEGKGDEKKVREMLTYVVEYRGVLNFNYSFVRHQAQAKLNKTG